MGGPPGPPFLSVPEAGNKKVPNRCQNGLPGGGGELLFGRLFLTGAPFGPRGLPGELPGHSRDPFFMIWGRFGVPFGASFDEFWGDLHNMKPKSIKPLKKCLRSALCFSLFGSRFCRQSTKQKNMKQAWEEKEAQHDQHFVEIEAEYYSFQI